MSTILFSGRFDKFHVGHLITIQRLMRQYKHVIVVILDYPEQKFPIAQRVEAIANALSGSKGSWEIIVSPYHFAEITGNQCIENFPWFDSYGSGNQKCLDNMNKWKISVFYIPRYPGYSASKEED